MHTRSLTLILIVGSLLAPPATAQNLVANGDFESFSNCPSFLAEFEFFVDFWTTANLGSPDYYNACDVATNCSGVPCMSVPDQISGTQTAHSGVAYGAGVFYATWPAREYIEAPLSSPLVAGRQYVVSFWVSLADASGFAIDGIGAHLSVGPLTASHAGPLLEVPQVLNVSGNITNTSDWVEITGSYVALGGEDHITIGNFGDTPSAVQAVTPLVPLIPDGAPALADLAYYHVDDVSVVANFCPDGGTVVDFESMAVSGSGIGSFDGVPYIEDGIEVWNDFPFLVYGDTHPSATSSTAVTSDNSYFFIRREGGGTFDACSVDLATTDAPPPHFVIFEGGPSEVHLITSTAPAVDTFIFTGYNSLTQLDINNLPITPRLAQFDNLCVCPTGSCSCTPSVTIDVDWYCVAGTSTGVGWSWQLDAEPLVFVSGLTPGATSAQIAVAFTDSINIDGPAMASALISSTQPACFQVAFTPGFTFSVGPQAGPVNCTATANPSGCSFNPTLTDADFLTPPPGNFQFATPVPAVPALATAGRLVVGLLLGVAIIANATRKRRSGMQSHT